MIVGSAAIAFVVCYWGGCWTYGEVSLVVAVSCHSKSRLVDEADLGSVA
jgi:hypothetical protein